MLLFLSFLILRYVGVKIYRKKQIEIDFEDFKQAVIRNDAIRNAVESFHLDKTTGKVFDELLRAANISEFIDISEKYLIPIQRLLYEWDYVPATNSPKHILNALNDDCVQEILRNLTDPSDFLSAAETCRDFQANALKCYPFDFTKLSLTDENKSVGRYSRLPLKHASNFLQIFGQLMWKIELICEFEDGNTIDTIARNCGERFAMMHIIGHENTKSNFNELSQFKNLFCIYISSISMDDVELPENLYCLNLVDVKVQGDLQCIMKKFSELKMVYFDKVGNLSDTAFNAFITLNPQINLLYVYGSHNLSFSAIDNISGRLPNLETLSINCITLTTFEYNEMVMHFSQFKNLMHLTIDVNFQLFIPAVTLINSLVANTPTIEELIVDGFHDYDQALPGLLKLLQLKELRVWDSVSSNTIAELVRTSPTLENIKFHCGTISVSEIINILKFSKNLTKLEIRIYDMDISLSVYNSILALIKGRLEVVLEIRDGNIDENIFKQNMQRLKIVKR